MTKKKKDKKKEKTTEAKNGNGVEQLVDKKEQGKEEESADKEIKELQDMLNEQKDKYLRLFAEFENYKKRTLREKLELMKTAAQDTMTALLPVLDDFDRAKKNAESENSAEVFTEGILLIYNKLYHVLKEKGLKPMETDGELFDPEFHEAITEIPAPSNDMKGKVIDTIEKGYMLSDKIIRHARVVVGK